MRIQEQDTSHATSHGPVTPPSGGGLMFAWLGLSWEMETEEYSQV